MQGDMTYMQCVQVGVDEVDVAVGVSYLMAHGDYIEDEAGDGDAMGDATGDFDAPEVVDASGSADGLGLVGHVMEIVGGLFNS